LAGGTKSRAAKNYRQLYISRDEIRSIASNGGMKIGGGSGVAGKASDGGMKKTKKPYFLTQHRDRKYGLISS
jgi:hypothetical protein